MSHPLFAKPGRGPQYDPKMAGTPGVRSMGRNRSEVIDRGNGKRIGEIIGSEPHLAAYRGEASDSKPYHECRTVSDAISYIGGNNSAGREHGPIGTDD